MRDDTDAPPPIFPQSQQEEPPSAPVAGRRWILAAIIVVVGALTIGVGTWFAVGGSDGGSGGDSSPRLAGQLTREFPTAPTEAWRVDARTVQGGGPAAKLLSPNAAMNSYGSPGSLSDGRFVVTLIDPDGGNSAGADKTKSIAVVDGRSGAANVYPLSVSGCSDRIVDGSVACTTATAAIVVRVDDGKVVATYPAGKDANNVAFNGSTVFVAGSEDSGRRVTAFANGRTTWSQVYPNGDFVGSGDSSSATATSELFAVSNGNILVVDADDGRLILNSGGSSQVTALSDGSIAVVTSTVEGADRTVKVVRAQGDPTGIPGNGVAVATVASKSRGETILAGDSLVDLADPTTRKALPLGPSVAAMGLPLITTPTQSWSPVRRATNRSRP